MRLFLSTIEDYLRADYSVSLRDETVQNVLTTMQEQQETISVANKDVKMCGKDFIPTVKHGWGNVNGNARQQPG